MYHVNWNFWQLSLNSRMVRDTCYMQQRVYWATEIVLLVFHRFSPAPCLLYRDSPISRSSRIGCSHQQQVVWPAWFGQRRREPNVGDAAAKCRALDGTVSCAASVLSGSFRALPLAVAVSHDAVVATWWTASHLDCRGDKTCSLHTDYWATGLVSSPGNPTGLLLRYQSNQ